MEVSEGVKKRDIVLDIPDQMYEDLLSLSKENMRSLNQEIMYRLVQGMKMNKHISENDEGLLKIIARLYDRDDSQYEQ